MSTCAWLFSIVGLLIFGMEVSMYTTEILGGLGVTVATQITVCIVGGIIWLAISITERRRDDSSE